MKLFDNIKNMAMQHRLSLLEIAAIIFMMVAWLISLGDYTCVIEKWWGLRKEIVHTTIRPNFLSTLFACGIYSAFVFRKLIKPFNRKATFVLTVLDIFYLASFIGMLTGGKQDPLPVIGISPIGLLVGALLFSFVGLRSLSGIIVLLLIVAALPRLSESNVAMGGAGAIFVVSGFVSLIIQARLPDMLPVGAHFNDFLADFQGVQGRVSTDVSSGVSMAEQTMKDVGKVGVKVSTAVATGSL